MRISGELAGLYYEEHGPPDGVPIILSSGLGGSANYWSRNLEGLTRGWGEDGPNRVIAYDHRGTGRSDRALPAEVSVEDFARDILALMDGLDVPMAKIVGHAAGGVAGLALALMAPERVERLVVVNGWAGPHPWFLRCFEARLALLRQSGPRAFVRAQPLFLYPPWWFDGAHDEELAAEEHHALTFFPGAETVEKRIAALAAFDIRDRLREIATPVLCIAAFDDMLVPWAESSRLAHGLPNGTCAMMDYGAHAANVVDPDGFESKALIWLGGHPLPKEQ